MVEIVDQEWLRMRNTEVKKGAIKGGVTDVGLYLELIWEG